MDAWASIILIFCYICKSRAAKQINIPSIGIIVNKPFISMWLVAGEQVLGWLTSSPDIWHLPLTSISGKYFPSAIGL